MAKPKVIKKVADKGKNVRLSTVGYEKIKKYVDDKKFWTLGPFIESCALAYITNEQLKGDE
jgi:hypothetical protein